MPNYYYFSYEYYSFPNSFVNVVFVPLQHK